MAEINRKTVAIFQIKNNRQLQMCIKMHISTFRYVNNS